jgi:hypothetical protein
MDLQPSLPTYDDLFEPTIKALKALGGSGSIQEIYDKVCALEGYSEEQQSVLGKKGSQTEIAYRLAWARTYLKTYGLLENVGRGVWSLTEAGRNLQTIDRKEINRVVKRKISKASPEHLRTPLHSPEQEVYLFEKIMKIKPQARADQLPSPFYFRLKIKRLIPLPCFHERLSDAHRTTAINQSPKISYCNNSSIRSKTEGRPI